MEHKSPVVCCVVDKNPRFRWEFIVWSQCLLRYCKGSNITIKSYWVDEIPQSIAEYALKYGIELVKCSTFRQESPHCNKIIPFIDESNKAYSHIIVTDSDLFIVSDISKYLLKQSVRLAPNNHNNPPIEIYHKLFTHSKITDSVRGGLAIFENNSGIKESYINNNSAGIIIISTDIVDSFTTSWIKWTDWLIHNRKLMSKWAVHVDQVGIAMTCEDIGLDINFLPPQLNAVLELLKKAHHISGFHIAKTHREYYQDWFNSDWTLISSKFSPFLANSIYKLNNAIKDSNAISETIPEIRSFVELRNSNKILFNDGSLIYNLVKRINTKKKNIKLSKIENKKKVIEESGIFDREYYASQFNHLNTYDNDLIDHFINIGSNKGFSPNKHFDFFKYRGKYKEVGYNKIDSFTHYCKYGLEKGYNPQPERFDIFKSYDEIKEEIESIKPVFKAPKISNDVDIRTIAFYLPQFHEIQENNIWWGEKFTEWTHVKTNVKNFDLHYAPRIPSDLGYYDLMEDQSIADRQIELAINSGLEGFAFYYYAFNDRIIMDKPIEKFRNKDLSYCIFWANHPWTRTWYGQERELLLGIDYNREFYLQFIQGIEKYLKDDNYIKINGKPLVMLLHHKSPDGPPNFEECAAMTDIWREYCLKHGIGEIHISFAQLNYALDYTKVIKGCGFDSCFEFCPTAELSGGITNMNTRIPLPNEFKGETYLYDSMIEKRRQLHENVIHKLYPCVTTAWDNSARYGNKAKTFIGATPTKFGDWVNQNKAYLEQNFSKEERILFVNGWNEWSEGSYLEPDLKYGYSYLDTLSKAIETKSL